MNIIRPIIMLSITIAAISSSSLPFTTLQGPVTLLCPLVCPFFIYSHADGSILSNLEKQTKGSNK